MANLRILDINAADSRTIKVRFSAALADDIGRSNVQVLSEAVNVPNIDVVGVEVIEDILIINTLPHTPYARYTVVFSSTNSVRFRSLDDRQFLIEDGRSNTAKILGAENDYNPTRDNLVTYLGGQQSVYNLSRETFIRTVLNQISDLLNKAQADVRQAKSANYLEILIKDEAKVRGFGPWDRLNQEGAFKVLRVGTGPTDETIQGVISLDSFPSDPITLQRDVVVNEALVLGFGSGTYNDLILTLNRRPVTKLTSVTIQYSNDTTFIYDIRSLGYQISDPKYDTQFGHRLITLSDNQVKLSDALKDMVGFVLPGGTDKIIVSYEYKSLGRVIDDTSVSVVEVVQVVREPAPAIITMFSVQKAPVVTVSDSLPIKGGIQFLDPYSETPFQNTHPAFLNEITYREGGLPNYPGEYSVDYSTGRVFVYGSETNDGTGSFPPAMNYYYRKTYVSRLDYTYVPEFRDLVASPLRELISKKAKINYLFEQTLVPGIDYNANVHVESRDERVQNRIATLDSVYTLNSPITDVFRIYNETTGEIYTPRRFSDQKIFFDSRVPPRIRDVAHERVSFTSVLNEPLIVESEFLNILSTRVLKISLQNNSVMGNTDDVIGSSFNSSVGFSQTDIFSLELYYDAQDPNETLLQQIARNTNRLSVGQYQVDYRNGIIYAGVTNTQNLNVGTVSYKKPVISPVGSHVISVSELYNSINLNFGPSKILDYTSFGEGAITPTVLDFSDERFTNKETTNPYIFYNGTITVTDDIKALRGIYDGYDLNHHADPVNFADVSTASENVITLGAVTQTHLGSAIDGYNITIQTISPGIDIGSVQSIVRVDTGAQLDGYALGMVVTLTVPYYGFVEIQYSIAMNGSATPIVDYNRGDFFADYSYLFDEILVTYEWGDNVIDHRQSNTIQEGETYYTSYTIGALRNSLLQNFGTLVRVPELQVFDEQLDREVYRDILQGALQTFTRGPTIPAMKDLISSVTQIDPEIIEATFWSLGVSYLEKLTSEILGTPYLTIGFFDQGLAVRKAGDGTTLPISNNLRLEEGTLELSVITDWNGIDNDATLTFEIFRDGYAVNAENVYIGTRCFNPEIVSGKFSVNRTDADSPEGLPVFVYTKTGVFIYYDDDKSQWKMLAKASLLDGYVYSGTITTSGAFYDVKFIQDLGESDDVLRSGIKTLEFEFHLDGYDVASPDGYDDGYADGYIPGFSFDGIQFMSDDQHYFFDFGKSENQNRFSLYKDGRGYLVFEVWDRGGFGNLQPSRRNVYQASADIRNWAAGQKHSVGISWILNSSDSRDEMHLFVDGFETPNIVRYGNIPSIASTERFRTVVPEQIVGVVFVGSVIGNDLTTNQGSSVVSSPSFSFDGYDGYTIDILEQGFSKYLVLNASGNQMTLNMPMPATLSGDARFIVNPPQFIVGTEIDIYKNIGVFVLSGGSEREIPGKRADIPSYSIDRNSLNQRILTIFDNVNAGDTVLIKTFGLNHRRSKDRVFLWSGKSILKTGLPPPINLDDVVIRTVILPLTPIGPGNSTFTDGYFTANFSLVSFVYLVDNYGNYLIDDGYNFLISGTEPGQDIRFTQPSTSLVPSFPLIPALPNEGRLLEIRVTGDNVDFTMPVSVTLDGYSTASLTETTETFYFSAPGKKYTTYKWKNIYSVSVTAKPFDGYDDSSAVEIKEVYSITEPNGNNLYPVIRFAYQTQGGVSLYSDGTDGYTVVSDPSGGFFQSDVGNLLQINSPAFAAGVYKILEVISSTTIRLNQGVDGYFTNGSYNCYNISIGRSGFQNGFLFLELAGFADVPFVLPPGWYDIDYASYLEVTFDPLTCETGIIGNDITLNKPAKAVIDEFRVLNRQLTDTRIGETIGAYEESITTGATKVSPFVKHQDTLALFHFNQLPDINDSDFYQFANKEYIQSGNSVNSIFGHSIVIKDKGLVFDNAGLLDTSNEGLVEFWVSPRYDTYNDPNDRVYFDAAANVIEDSVSLTKRLVKVSGRVGRVLYVRLASDTDLQGTEYFGGGSVDTDGKILILNTPLPFQNTPVKVAYVSTGVYGDRITISKDHEGFICFTVMAHGNEYQIRQPVFWPRNTWHRIRASFKFNRRDNNDELRLFVDGEERGTLLFGSGVLFGQGLVWGQTAVGSQIYRADINFTDAVHQFSFGQDFAGNFGAQARFDNLKISNKAVEPLTIAGQPRDVYYNTNSDFVYPVIEDAFTTFLFDFDKFVEKTEDFAIIHDPVYGVFNFDINIIDSFGIVTGDPRVKTVLEALINALKPAVYKVGIKYVK
jgi:hypothetical protein